jgi:glycosyltransferase involved in cell wall biosynthesis
LIPIQIPAGTLDDNAKKEAQDRFRHVLQETLAARHVDVVHMHGLDFLSYLPRCDCPLLVTLHLPLPWYGTGPFGDAGANLAYVCVSQSQARKAPPGLKRSKVIPNGIDLDLFRPSAHKGEYALILGRICPEKGIHLAIDAARLARVRLIIAGKVFDYPEHRKYFDQKVRPRLGDDAHFLRAIAGTRKANLIAGAKCLLIPSLCPETSSLTAMEALACGTPVIAWNSGALPEIISHGRTGFLVSSVEEMAEAIRSIRKLSRIECRREAERRFSQQQMVSNYMNVYLSLVHGTPARELQAA